jgi:hypothetical protein
MSETIAREAWCRFVTDGRVEGAAGRLRRQAHGWTEIMRVLFLLALLASVAAFSGCAGVQDLHYEATNSARSEWAWVSTSKNPLVWVWPSDYGHGWKEGYFDVSMGGTGCPPSLPPNKYWSAGYQTCEGQEKAKAWYAGYQDGATAAEMRGAGRYHYLRPQNACPIAECPANPNSGPPGDALPNGTLPSGALPSGTMPGDALPNGGLPNGALPNGAMPGGAMPYDGPGLMPPPIPGVPPTEALPLGPVSNSGQGYPAGPAMPAGSDALFGAPSLAPQNVQPPVADQPPMVMWPSTTFFGPVADSPVGTTSNRAAPRTLPESPQVITRLPQVSEENSSPAVTGFVQPIGR